MDTTANSPEQLSLFGDEYAPSIIEKKKSNSQKPARAEKPANSPARSAKDQNIEVDLDFSIHYATHTFQVADFVTDVPDSGKISLKQLREKMELQFFELTEQRTVWDYDLETRRLMPYASGTTKG
ncbi:hypothetical protein [Paenibacillus sp. GYB003]|uniref:hypothetical protein n=1 Tax=Paenibacillus sp. GYB003 TaxID=2994392 RepID=UPI002F960BDC